MSLLGVTPAFSKSCDWVAEEEEKGLASSGVAGVLGVSPKPVLLPDEEEDEGSMGTSWMAAQMSNSPEASLAELAVPIDTVADMMSCLTCTPRPWLPVVVMGHPLARNLQVTCSQYHCHNYSSKGLAVTTELPKWHAGGFAGVMMVGSGALSFSACALFSATKQAGV